MSKSKQYNTAHEQFEKTTSAVWQDTEYNRTIIKKTRKLMKKPKKSLDGIWSSIANLCLFSYCNADGNEVFVSSEDTRNLYGQGREDTFREYPVFVPDAIVNRVAGKIGKAKNKHEVLVAYIDGSHSFDDKKGCCAYSVFFQVGDRIAEYANTVCDDDRRYGATAAELMAAIVAIKVAISHGYKHVELRHDYTGVAFFSDDSDTFPNKKSKMYWVFNQYEAFLHCARQLIDISYTKVKSHSLDVGNEHADFLARTFSKRARMESDKTLARIRNSVTATPQMASFAKAYEIDSITFDEVEALMVERGFQKHFGFDEVEMNLIKKMLRDTSTEEIMSLCLLTRKQLSEHRRSIIVKLGMPADAAADNTIVKRTLNWLYLGKLNPKKTLSANKGEPSRSERTEDKPRHTSATKYEHAEVDATHCKMTRQHLPNTHQGNKRNKDSPVLQTAKPKKKKSRTPKSLNAKKAAQPRRRQKNRKNTRTKGAYRRR